MARAEHIFVKRHGYTHHGIDTGEGTVIHYAAKPGKIIETPIESFVKGSPIPVRDYSICYSPDVVMDRAKSRIGEARYSLISNNCEHFATWCKTGLGTSQQVHRAGASTAGIGGGGLASAAGLAVVSATGAAAGLSGSGIISGLATIGAW